MKKYSVYIRTRPLFWEGYEYELSGVYWYFIQKLRAIVHIWRHPANKHIVIQYKLKEQP
jgi:hypothetical protein